VLITVVTKILHSTRTLLWTTWMKKKMKPCSVATAHRTEWLLTSGFRGKTLFTMSVCTMWKWTLLSTFRRYMLPSSLGFKWVGQVNVQAGFGPMYLRDTGDTAHLHPVQTHNSRISLNLNPHLDSNPRLSPQHPPYPEGTFSICNPRTRHVTGTYHNISVKHTGLILPSHLRLDPPNAAFWKDSSPEFCVHFLFTCLCILFFSTSCRESWLKG
jgi:hypothetical protein